MAKMRFKRPSWDAQKYWDVDKIYTKDDYEEYLRMVDESPYSYYRPKSYLEWLRKELDNIIGKHYDPEEHGELDRALEYKINQEERNHS